MPTTIESPVRDCTGTMSITGTATGLTPHQKLCQAAAHGDYELLKEKAPATPAPYLAEAMEYAAAGGQPECLALLYLFVPHEPLAPVFRAVYAKYPEVDTQWDEESIIARKEGRLECLQKLHAWSLERGAPIDAVSLRYVCDRAALRDEVECLRALVSFGLNKQHAMFAIFGESVREDATEALELGNSWLQELCAANTLGLKGWASVDARVHDIYREAFIDSANSGSIRCMVKLRGWGVNSTDDYNRALFNAERAGYLEVVAMLRQWLRTAGGDVPRDELDEEYADYDFS